MERSDMIFIIVCIMLISISINHMVSNICKAAIEISKNKKCCGCHTPKPEKLANNSEEYDLKDLKGQISDYNTIHRE